jgi:hypothetical protein
MQAAQAKYDGQDYPNAMSEIKQALLIKATDATALDLEKRVQDQLAGLGVLTAAQEQFNSGDYAFTNGPDFLARTNQPAFGSLLSQAGAEAAQLAQLTGLVQTKDWAGVNAGLATLSPGALKKPPFATIVKWREDNNPVNLRDAELHQLNAVFTRHVDKSFARAAKWPDLESGKARFLGLPITVDAIEDMNYKTNYLGRLESLRANFDRLGALDDSRKKNLQALKKVIDDWLPPNN